MNWWYQSACQRRMVDSGTTPLATAPTTRVAQLAGRLHDIGKVIIPEVVLTKPGALSEEEWRLLRQHPDFGYRLARMVPGFHMPVVAAASWMV